MSRELPLYAAIAATLLAVAIGAIGFVGGAWAKAAPALVPVCIAAIMAGWATSRKAKANLLGAIQALLPEEGIPAGQGAEHVMQSLGLHLDAARQERNRALAILSHLPIPCMTVSVSGELGWSNESMAELMGENGRTAAPAGNGQAAAWNSVAAFCARTSAGTWENLCARRWDGPLLRLARPGNGESMYRAVLVELGGNPASLLCLFQDVTEQCREAVCLDGQRAAVQQLQAHIKEETAALEGLAQEINQGLASLVDSMQDSQAQAQQVAQAMQEMTDNVRMVATMAAETAKTATGAEDQAREGGGTVKQSAEVTHKVVDSYDHLQGILSQLVDEAGNVGSVVGIISDIADQTNLLALNAAIEAARAGDAGRGFAVVADEVRKLAEKTITATKEVHAAVQAIATCSNRAVEAMAATSQDIRTSFDLVMSVENSFTAIAEAMVSASRGIEDIAHRAEKQCASSFEINMCAMNVTDNTQEVYGEIQGASRNLERLVKHIAEVRALAGEVRD